jgi:hypothetical protein
LLKIKSSVCFCVFIFWEDSVGPEQHQNTAAHRIPLPSLPPQMIEVVECEVVGLLLLLRLLVVRGHLMRWRERKVMVRIIYMGVEVVCGRNGVAHARHARRRGRRHEMVRVVVGLLLLVRCRRLLRLLRRLVHLLRRRLLLDVGRCTRLLRHNHLLLLLLRLLLLLVVVHGGCKK